MFDLILCQRDFKEIQAIAPQNVIVEEWKSDEQLKAHLASGKKLLLVTDKSDVKPDIFNLYHLNATENMAFYHFSEEVVIGDGFFPGVNDLVLCKDYYRDSGIFLVINGDFGALPTFTKKTLFTVEDYIGFDQYKPALFFDRDGVINVDHSYVYKIEDLQYCDGVEDFICSKEAKDHLKFIVTNQAGVGRGMYTEEDVHLFNGEILNHFKKKGVTFQDVQISPYHFEKGEGEYKWHSLVRKPHPGMVLKITHKFPVDLKNSWMIGDKVSDHLDMALLNFVHIKGNYDLSKATSPIAENFDQLKNIVFCS
jgi:D-glycero-D-manno-heptose 1,7-bisphosphate phosphatase